MQQKQPVVQTMCRINSKKQDPAFERALSKATVLKQHESDANGAFTIVISDPAKVAAPAAVRAIYPL